MKNIILLILIFISFISLSQTNKKCFTTELIQKELDVNNDYKNHINEVYRENKKWISENLGVLDLGIVRFFGKRIQSWITRIYHD